MSKTLGAVKLGTKPAKVDVTQEQPVQEQPAQERKSASEPAKEKETPIGVLFRLNSADHEIVSNYARGKKWSMQELLENALNEMFDRAGLKLIKGRPRGKKAGKPSK